MSLPRFALAALLAASPWAQGASFNCAKASTASENMICADRALSALDDKLGAAYVAAIERLGNQGLVRQWQREWLRSWELRACKDAGCARPLFAARIAALDSAIASPWNGQYIRYAGSKVDRHAADIMLIATREGGVIGAGSTLWLGVNADSGQVNTGEFAALGGFAGDALEFDQDACHVRITRQDAVLKVEDSAACGGLNVTFSGTYRRKAVK